MASSSLQPAAVVYRRIADKFTPTTPYRRAVRSLVVPAKLPKVPIAIEINDSQRVFDLRSDGIADGLLTSTGVARAQLRIRTICWPPPIALICLPLRTVLHAFPQFVEIS